MAQATTGTTGDSTPSPGPSASEALRAYVAAQHADLERDLPSLDDPEAVHRTRTRARRVRSVLGAYGDHAPPTGRLRKDLRALGRTAGHLRDLDIIRERVAEVPMATTLLDHERRSVLDDVHEEIASGRFRRMMHTLAGLGEPEAWAGCPEAPMSTVAEEVLADELERVFRRDRAAAQPGANRAVALHDVRKAAKRLRYAAEAGGPAYADLAVRAQALQDLLGEANDGLATAAWLDRAARAHPDHAHFAEHAERHWSSGHVDPAAYEVLLAALRESSA